MCACLSRSLNVARSPRFYNAPHPILPFFVLLILSRYTRRQKPVQAVPVASGSYSTFKKTD